MSKIEKYVANFLKKHDWHPRYGFYATDIFELGEATERKPFGTLCLIFDYGYAKGYRAAQAEMKKGGAV